MVYDTVRDARMLTFVMVVVEAQAELLSPTLPVGTLQLGSGEVVQLHFLHQEGARHGDSRFSYSPLAKLANKVPDCVCPQPPLKSGTQPNQGRPVPQPSGECTCGRPFSASGGALAFPQQAARGVETRHGFQVHVKALHSARF